MVLGFKEYYPFDKSRPTEFQRKIARSYKIHTFRRGFNRRFKVGQILHMATGVRTKNYFCFDDTKTCTAIQEILIVYLPNKNRLEVRVNRRRLKQEQITMMIANDGFDNRQDFIKWFFPDGSTVWAGRVIHWTNFKY